MTLGVNSASIQNNLDQLFSSILSEQQNYMGVRAPDPDKAKIMQKELGDFEPLRGKGFFYNYLATGRGHGPFAELVDGSIKYDLICGIGPMLLGHSHPLYIRALLEASTVDTVMCGNLQIYEVAKKLTEVLVNAVQEKSRLRHFWFSGSGSFANDVALKILWQKCSPKYNLIAFNKAFAGRSVATQDITFNPAYRVGQPDLVPVRHAPFYDQNDPRGSIDKTIKALDEIWDKEPDTFCAISLELIQGEGGFVYAPRDFYVEVFKWAKDKGLYIWVDEIQTFARTHELFAYQMYNLDEYVDIVTIAKVLQAAGTFYTPELNPKPGLIAGTFNGSIASLTAGYKIISYLLEGGFYGANGRIKEIEDKMLKGLEKLKQGPCGGKIGYCGGVGAMISFEVGDSSKELSTTFVKKLFENGIVSFTAGNNPTRIRFLLPTSLTDEHMDEIFSIIEKTVLEVV